jgi:hypothetical protein
MPGLKLVLNEPSSFDSSVATRRLAKFEISILALTGSNLAEQILGHRSIMALPLIPDANGVRSKALVATRSIRRTGRRYFRTTPKTKPQTVLLLPEISGQWWAATHPPKADARWPYIHRQVRVIAPGGHYSDNRLALTPLRQLCVVDISRPCRRLQPPHHRQPTP